MTKIAKSITYQRSDIISFEQEAINKYYVFQVKEYNPENHIINESEFRGNGVKEMEAKYVYDEKQNLICKQTFYPMEETEEKLVHIYDEKGQKIRDENYFGEDLFEKVIYEYDDKGNMVSQTRMDEDDMEIEKQETAYNDDGKMIKQSFSANGELEREVEFEYDASGICVKEIHYRPLDKSKEIIEYVYNEAGKKTSSTSTDAEGNTIGYIDIEYDEKMNPIKYTSETSGFYNSKAINQITYDEEGRAIENEYFDVLNNFLMSKEKVTYDEEGNVSEQEIFEIKPEAGLKKTHFRLKLKYEFHEG